MRHWIRSHLTFASVVSPAALLVVLVLMAPTASAHNPQHPLKVSGTWSDPPEPASTTSSVSIRAPATSPAPARANGREPGLDRRPGH